jgi:hypothetical protein
MSWAESEFADLDLGDKRLDKRLKLLIESLSSNPMASIPEACGGWSETQGAYRFFSQDELDWRDILKPHWKNTQIRMKAHKIVLCLQDTTELDFNGQSIVGLGRLSYEAQKGMYVHPTYAVSVDREPLGVLDAWMWARGDKDAQEIKESTRWIEGYERICELAGHLPDTRLVYVADRESDMLELMLKGRDLKHKADWLIRSTHNRVLEDGKLWDSVMKEEAIGCVSFTIPSRAGSKARRVQQEIRSKRIHLPDRSGGVIEVTCVIAREVNAPADIKPLEWRLLTNRLANDFELAAELIDWYRARWEIELFFHVFKNGCKVEALQLSSIERLERALSLFMVVAWRIARLMRLGRTCPDLDASLLFSQDEWKAAFILNKKKPPKVSPKLNEVIRLTAILGGFLARKSDGEPGVKTIWQGLSRLTDFVFGMQYAREFQEV